MDLTRGHTATSRLQSQSCTSVLTPSSVALMLAVRNGSWCGILSILIQTTRPQVAGNKPSESMLLLPWSHRAVCILDEQQRIVVAASVREWVGVIWSDVSLPYAQCTLRPLPMFFGGSMFHAGPGAQA